MYTVLGLLPIHIHIDEFCRLRLAHVLILGFWIFPSHYIVLLTEWGRFTQYLNA